MTILVNYAHGKFLDAQKLNIESGLSEGGFDKALPLGFTDLPRKFRRKNKRALERTRGAGFWIWKPQVCLEAIEKARPDELIVYCDAGQRFIGPYQPLVDAMGDHPMVFTESGNDRQSGGRRTVASDSKRLVLDFYGIAPESPEGQADIASGNLFAFRNSPEAIDFLTHWRDDMTRDPRMVDNKLNDPLPEYPQFVRHKHDMASLSCLRVLRGYPILDRATKHTVIQRVRGDSRTA